MSEELQTAAQNYVSGLIPAHASDGFNELIEIHKAFEAGAAWHKSRAFMEIIKDIQKSGGVLIVEPMGGVSVDPNTAGGVNFTRIKETEVFSPPIAPEMIDTLGHAIFGNPGARPGNGPAFSFPGKKIQLSDPNPSFPKKKKGFFNKRKYR